MLAKITSKNQLTLPKSLVQAVGATDYFDVEARGGQLILTPVRIQRGDAVRAKLEALDITEADVAAAVAWSRSSTRPLLLNEPPAAYASPPNPLDSAATSAKPKRSSVAKPSGKT
jgi:hypothetical protein